jgi:hypothetical protein
LKIIFSGYLLLLEGIRIAANSHTRDDGLDLETDVLFEFVTNKLMLIIRVSAMVDA